jgi:hypothetical protein
MHRVSVSRQMPYNVNRSDSEHKFGVLRGMRRDASRLYVKKRPPQYFKLFFTKK